MNKTLQFVIDEDGLTAIEYVMAASLIVAGLVTLFTGFGTTLQEKLTAVLAKIT